MTTTPTTTEDPVSQIARWRPRPEHVEARRLSGEVETYPVTSGRRAWQRLRALLPGDAVELVGRRGGAIVGRWQAPTAPAAVEELLDVEDDLDDEHDDDDDIPSHEASLVRWTIREMRGVYADQLRATREVIGALADAMRVQRETLVASMHQPARAQDDDDEDGGYGKLADILTKAAGLIAMQASSRPLAAAPGTVPPPRDSSAP